MRNRDDGESFRNRNRREREDDWRNVPSAYREDADRDLRRPYERRGPEGIRERDFRDDEEFRYGEARRSAPERREADSFRQIEENKSEVNTGYTNPVRPVVKRKFTEGYSFELSPSVISFIYSLDCSAGNSTFDGYTQWETSRNVFYADDALKSGFSDVLFLDDGVFLSRDKQVLLRQKMQKERKDAGNERDEDRKGKRL